MKKKYIVVLFLAISALGFCQRKPKIKGSRNVVEVRDSLSGFHTIKLASDLDIVIQKGSFEGYTIEADDNLLDVLRFNISDSILRISSFYKITRKKKLNITVFYSELTELEQNHGSIRMNDVVSSERLDIVLGGNAKLELNASANVLNISMSDNSKADLNVASDSLSVILKDRVDAKLFATGKEHALYMYKNAALRLEGSTDFFMAKLYGSASLKSELFNTLRTVLIAEDSPTSRVNVSNDFQLSSRGGSRTILYGEAKITILDFLDTSKLEKHE